MTVTTVVSSPTTESAAEAPPEVGATPVAGGVSGGEDRLVDEDLLVEDVSIDGMCGVY